MRCPREARQAQSRCHPPGPAPNVVGSGRVHVSDGEINALSSTFEQAYSPAWPLVQELKTLPFITCTAVLEMSRDRDRVLLLPVQGTLEISGLARSPGRMLPRQCGFLLRGAPTPYARAELSRSRARRNSPSRPPASSASHRSSAKEFTAAG